jgi:hypothetical protein
VTGVMLACWLIEGVRAMFTKALFGCSISDGGLSRFTGGGRSLEIHLGAYESER